MAKSIIKGAGKLLGLGKKKKAAEPAAAAEQKGPIVKQLNPVIAALDPRRRNPFGRRLADSTILSDKLGA